MKAKVGDIINGAQVVQSWGGYPTSPTFSFALARLVRAAEPIIKTYEEQRIKLLKQYGKPPADVNGDYTFDNQDARNACGIAINELAMQEIELPGVEPLPMEMLEAEIARTLGFMPRLSDLIAVAWLFAPIG